MNFPDPWEKRKWHKNRMIQPETVLQWRELLKDDGIFSFKTDHEDYFKHAVKTFSNNSYKIIKQTEDLYNSEYLTDNIPTEFERLFCSKGKKIFFLEALKQQ